MKIAIPVWEGRISPVFDTARQLLLVDELGGRETDRHFVSMAGAEGILSLELLRRLGVEVLLCGAITRPLWMSLSGSGVRVIPNLFGEVEAILRCYLAGDDVQKQFTLQRRRRMRRHRGGRQDRMQIPPPWMG